MSNKFDLGMDVVCTKVFEKLKVGYTYHINGCGELYNSGCKNKSGLGFSIEYVEWNWNTLKTKTIYFFTESEMDEYFITKEEDYKIRIREQKINDLL